MEAVRKEALIDYIEQVCAYTLYKYSCFEVPVDLEAIAQGLGVSRIEYKEMNAEGHVEIVSSETVIRIRHDAPEARQRFSLAHEIGHLLIDRLVQAEHTPHSKRFRSFASVDHRLNEESIADQIAGFLILPTWYMQSAIGDRLSIRRLETAAKLAKASLSAALIRAVRMSSMPCVAFHARRNGDQKYRLMWSRASRSVRNGDAHEDLNSSEVLSSLIENHRIKGASCAAKISWGSCESVIRRFQDIENVYAIASVK